MIYECNVIKPIWNLIENMLSVLCQENVSLEITDVIFGIDKGRFIHPNYSDLCNLIVRQAKWHIWKHRNNLKMDEKQPLKSCHIFRIIVQSIKDHADMLLNSCKVRKVSTLLRIKLHNLLSQDFIN